MPNTEGACSLASHNSTHTQIRHCWKLTHHYTPPLPERNNTALWLVYHTPCNISAPCSDQLQVSITLETVLTAEMHNCHSQAAAQIFKDHRPLHALHNDSHIRRSTAPNGKSDTCTTKKRTVHFLQSTIWHSLHSTEGKAALQQDNVRPSTSILRRNGEPVYYGSHWCLNTIAPEFLTACHRQ